MSDDDVYRIDSECIVDKVIVVCLRQEEDGHLQFVNVLKRDDDDQKNFFLFHFILHGISGKFLRAMHEYVSRHVGRFGRSFDELAAHKACIRHTMINER